MSARLACNYAVICFVPYVESGEFVNIGIVLNCPKTGFLDFRIEKQRHRRISNFFPELKVETLKQAIRVFDEDVTRLREHVEAHQDASAQSPSRRELAQALFQELVRPRESIIRCGAPWTLLADDPLAALEELFARYVERFFAHDRNFQEEIVR